jgi:hypothetical protein
MQPPPALLRDSMEKGAPDVARIARSMSAQGAVLSIQLSAISGTGFADD